MSCTLNKLTTYNVGRIVHDNSSGSYFAEIVQPPSSCPDKSFTSKKAELRVVEGMRPQLTFDMAKGHAVIIVPTTAYVEEVGSSGFGLGFYLFLFAALAGVAYLVTRLARSSSPALAGGSGTGRSYGGPSYGSNPVAPSGGGGTTVINNGSNNDGLLTGVMIGSMMSNNRSERIVENNTTIIERDSSSRDSSDSDDSSSSNSFSSDDDSSSSFSSDSDSSSSFSSDSGGSDFSSDSGGGSFSSDS
jgi:hypothetical protein